MCNDAFDFTPYTGVTARFEDPRHSAVLLENSTISMNIYRAGTVDWQVFHESVVLTQDTAEALYSQFTPLDVVFTPGTRVFLEKIVTQLTDGMSSDREKALKLVDWVRDIPENYRHTGNEAFHGGTEEEVIKKGSSMCNEQARVLIVLAQIAGLPSRYVGHMVQLDYDAPHIGTGHGVVEIFIDGGWAYFDIRGKFFQKPDGQIASTWDLISNPSIIDNQPQEVMNHYRYSTKVATSKRWFEPASINVIANYSASDHGNYDYSWVYPSESLWNEAKERGRMLRTTKHKDILPQPMIRG